jgi:hypothetical protein
MSFYQTSFFDEADRLAKLSQLQDLLEALTQYIDFEIFRAQLEAVFVKERKSAAGRKPYDAVLMFKILLLQRLYNLLINQPPTKNNEIQSAHAISPPDA